MRTRAIQIMNLIELHRRADTACRELSPESHNAVCQYVEAAHDRGWEKGFVLGLSMGLGLSLALGLFVRVLPFLYSP